MNELDTGDDANLNLPENQTPTQLDDSETAVEFFPVSEGKLITLYILSFGLYGFYWFYKNWQLQQPKMDKKISPVLRATFSIFFTHALFRRINKSAENLQQKHKFHANALATFFVGAVIVGNLLDPGIMSTSIMERLTNNTVIITSLVIFILSVYPLVVVQATVNRINNDMLGYLNHKYSVWNYLLIALGAIFWLMLGLNILAESMGLVPAQ
jgi:hypothetical protein